MHSLPIFVRLQGKPVILAGAGEAADAKRRLLERAGAVVVDENGDARLAIVAEDNPEEAVDRLRARGILVNAVDRPDLCDFTLPAIVDRDPVLVAIGTGGASAGLVKALRQRFELLLPQALGQLADALHHARDATRERWPGSATRRKAIDAALDQGGPLDPFAEMSAASVDTWLAGEGTHGVTGVALIQLTSDDPDDLTLREARFLAQADCLVYSSDVPDAIIDRARADAVRLQAARPPDPLPDGLTVQIVRGY